MDSTTPGGGSGSSGGGEPYGWEAEKLLNGADLDGSQCLPPLLSSQGSQSSQGLDTSRNLIADSKELDVTMDGGVGELNTDITDSGGCAVISSSCGSDGISDALNQSIILEDTSRLDKLDKVGKVGVRRADKPTKINKQRYSTNALLTGSSDLLTMDSPETARKSLSQANLHSPKIPDITLPDQRKPDINLHNLQSENRNTIKEGVSRSRNTSFSLFHEVITFPDGNEGSNKHEILIHETISYPNTSSEGFDTSKTTSNNSSFISDFEEDNGAHDDNNRKWIQQMFETKRSEIYEMRQKKLSEIETDSSADSTLRRMQIIRRMEMEQLLNRKQTPTTPDLPTSPRPPSLGHAFPRSVSSLTLGSVSTPSSPASAANASATSSPLSGTKKHARRLSVLSEGIARSPSKSNITDSNWSLTSLWSKSSPFPARRSVTPSKPGSVSSNKYVPCTIDKSEIVFSGQIQKKNILKRWKKRWVVLTQNQLCCFKNEPSQKAKCIELRLSSFKSDPTGQVFWVVTPSITHCFYVDSAEKFLEWSQNVLRICNNLMLDSIDASTPAMEEKSEIRKELEALQAQPENSICADCCSRNPQWASISIGVFLCIECSGIHRGLGVSVSKVRSVVLDLWEPDWIKRMLAVGNRRANELWEAKLPTQFKISEHSTPQQREDFIRQKYICGAYKNEPLTLHRDPSADLSGVKDVFVYVEGTEECVGFVEIDISLSLSALRQMMQEEGIIVPPAINVITNGNNETNKPELQPTQQQQQQQAFSFLFKQAPVTLKQESKKTVKDCIVSKQATCSIVIKRRSGSDMGAMSNSMTSIPAFPSLSSISSVSPSHAIPSTTMPSTTSTSSIPFSELSPRFASPDLTDDNKGFGKCG